MIGSEDTKFLMENLKTSLLLMGSSKTGYNISHFIAKDSLLLTQDCNYLQIYVQKLLFSQDFAIKTVKSTHQFWKALISKQTSAGELNW